MMILPATCLLFSILLCYPLFYKVYGFSSSLKGCPTREPPNPCLFSTPKIISLLATPYHISRCLGVHHKPFLKLCHPKMLLNRRILSNVYEWEIIARTAVISLGPVLNEIDVVVASSWVFRMLSTILSFGFHLHKTITTRVKKRCRCTNNRCFHCCYGFCAGEIRRKGL